MSLIRKFIDLLRNRPPIIMTEFGPVTESARRQAATNMSLDHELRERVVALIQAQLGGNREMAEREARRRYPEAGWEDHSDKT